MTKEELAQVFEKVFAECNATREAGQLEYARVETNAFGNFQRILRFMPELSQEKILMVYLLKHVDGIMSFVNGHKSQRESVKGRIVDAINYLIILYAMVLVQEKEQTTQHEWFSE